MRICTQSAFHSKACRANVKKKWKFSKVSTIVIAHGELKSELAFEKEREREREREKNHRKKKKERERERKKEQKEIEKK